MWLTVGQNMQIILQKSNELLQIIFQDGTTLVIYAWQAIALFCISAAVFVALYLLMGFGLRRMAINGGVKLPWLAFVPLARYYLAGRIAGASRLFGKKMKNAGFWLAIVATVYFVLDALLRYFNYYPIAAMFFRGDIVVFERLEIGWGYTADFVYNDGVKIFMQVGSYLNLVASLLYYFFFILVFMQIFKKFNPRNYFTFSLLTFFGMLFGFSVASIIVFTQRNKKAVNYNDYLKEQYMRMQGMYAPPRENPPDNPFREFGGRGENDPGDPFSEFGGKPSDEGGKDDDKNDKGGGTPFEGF